MLNAHAGSAVSQGVDPAGLTERFAALGYDVTVDAHADRPFADRLEAARRSPAPVLVAAGGDGTATALAGLAIETGRPLAVLPLGTANLLARDLSLPLTVDEWFDVYETMVPRRIDVGEVNGRVFLHKVVVGAMPGIAAAREHVRGGRLAAKLAFIAHAMRRLSRLRRFAAEITRDEGEPHIERVQSIAVANNSYDEAPGRVFSRSRLDRGTLSLYLLRQLSVADALRLAAEMMVGAWRDDAVLEIEKVTSATVRTRGRRVRAMVDGEVEMLRGPLAFRILPQALAILAPASSEAATEAAIAAEAPAAEPDAAEA